MSSADILAVSIDSLEERCEQLGAELRKCLISPSTEVLNIKNCLKKAAPNMVRWVLYTRKLLLFMIFKSYPALVKEILKPLPTNDYPVLNTRLFVSCWLGYALDKSLTSMRDLFKRLNNTGFDVDISSFSKASKHRSQEVFLKIYGWLICQAQKNYSSDRYAICPIDSTVITLTSKLLWSAGFSQVKLVSGLNLLSGVMSDNLVNFGCDHDYNYGKKMVEALPSNGVAVMDRGFASLKFLAQMTDANQYFVLRISKQYKLVFDENSELVKVGTGDHSSYYRVVNFCDLQTQEEYRLVTNLPSAGAGAVSNEEIGEIYRCRWGIELLWKFLKMHLKLDELITKNVNGIAIQIYATLIAYLILKLIEIPSEWGNKLLDKLRYLQACMCQQISHIHWMERIMRC
jgi:putative transposase